MKAAVLGKHLLQIVNKRAAESADKSIKVHTDKEYNDNPMDRVDQAICVWECLKYFEICQQNQFVTSSYESVPCVDCEVQKVASSLKTSFEIT